MSLRAFLLAGLVTLGGPATVALSGGLPGGPHAGGHALSAQELAEAQPEEVGMSSEGLATLSRVLQEYVDDERLPGAAAMVLRDGRVVFDEAVGFRELGPGEAAGNGAAGAEGGGDPLEPDDIFRIASQTKAVITTAVMILQEEGRLLISDPLSRHLPEWADVRVAEPTADGGYELVAPRRPITLRHLLTHTSGVGYGRWLQRGPGSEEWADAGITGWYFGHREEPIRETVRRMAALPLPAHPGEQWMYGFNTDILGAVVEVASGMPLDRFLDDRIFGPLAMDDTHFYLPPGKADRLAGVYALRPGRTVTRAPDGPGMNTQGQYVDGPRASFSGGAGLLSTTEDYARFLQMLLNGGELDGERILSPTTVDLMTADHVGELYSTGNLPPGGGMGFGLGFRVRTDVGAAGVAGSVGDYGWLGAYHSIYWVDPVEELVMVYLTNVTPAAGLDDHEKFRALVYAAITDSRAD